jgi:hypothetical protein
MCTNAWFGTRVLIILILNASLGSSDWFKWGDSGPSVASSQWDALVREGIDLHSKYMHGKARELLVKTAKYHHPHQKEIVHMLLNSARSMLVEGEGRDEVCARRSVIFFCLRILYFLCQFYLCSLLESAMAVAQLLMDAETIYHVSNELINANSFSAAIDGYHFVLKLLPTLPSAYHQLGLTLSVS